MSCWHDPRGRLVVDGEGRAVRRLVPGHHGAVYVEPIGMVRRMRWVLCGRTFDCEGERVMLRDRRYLCGERQAPHSCRPERHQ